MFIINILGTNICLGSQNDAKIYCKSKNVPFDPKICDFSGKNNFTGIINPQLKANCLNE